MLSFPNAKINLGLYVTGKRLDGFHSVESVFYPIPLNDVVEIMPAQAFHFQLAGMAVPGAEADNLCVKAFRLLQKDFGLAEISMCLLKHVPMGAGLGGGSADASFVLKLLNTLFDLNLGDEKLEDYAAQLGSDCPFFIRNIPAYVTGRGEIMEPIDFSLAGWYISLVHPRLHISTAEAYRNIVPKAPSTSIREVIRQPVESWRDMLGNDFEAYAFREFPAIAQIKEDFYASGAAYSAMTGSGSAVFALSKEPLDMSPFRDKYFTWQAKLS